MPPSDDIDYDALAETMLAQWQMNLAQHMQNPAMLKAMTESMTPFWDHVEGVNPAAALMMQQMQAMQHQMKHAREKNEGDRHEPPSAKFSTDDAVDADELAWVKQRLAACEARIAMLEAKID